MTALVSIPYTAYSIWHKSSWKTLPWSFLVEINIIKRQSSRSNERTRRLMTLIVALIMSYLVCWTPLHLFHLLTAFEYRMNMDACTAFEHVYNGYVHARKLKNFNSHAWNRLHFSLIWFNSALNPILYSFLGHGFKMKLYEAVNKMRRILPSKGNKLSFLMTFWYFGDIILIYFKAIFTVYKMDYTIQNFHIYIHFHKGIYKK